MKRILLTVAALALAAPALALAGTGPGEKLAHGIGDTATGWVETPKEMVEESNRTNPAVGVTKGAVVGVAKTAKKTVKGIAETATFFIPDNGK